MVTKTCARSSGRSEITRCANLLALRGVGARAELVEEDQRALAELLEHAADPQELHPELALRLIGARVLEQRHEEARGARQTRRPRGDEEAGLAEAPARGRWTGGAASSRPSWARSNDHATESA